MTIRVFDDETGEELNPEDVVFQEDDGNIATLEGDEDEILEDLVLPVIVEAILDGRLPSTDEELQEVAQLGLSLGVVVNTQNGLALSRDVEQSGLALGASTIGFSPSMVKASLGARFGKKLAQGKGMLQRAGKSTGAYLAANSRKLGTVAAGGAAITAATYAGVRSTTSKGNNNPSKSPLVANAEARNKK